MNVHEARVASDFREMQAMHSQVITWQRTAPKAYRVTFNVRSVVRVEADDTPVYANRHEVELIFPISYPREKPIIRLVSERVFHPNVFADGRICIRDDWDITLPLPRLIEHIGEIIQYQAIGLASPANPNAARWVTRVQSTTPALFPTDTTRLIEPSVTWR